MEFQKLQPGLMPEGAAQEAHAAVELMLRSMLRMVGPPEGCRLSVGSVESAGRSA